MKPKNEHGALFIEYALILAFVLVAGMIFISSNGMKDSVASIFGNTNDRLAHAVNGVDGPVNNLLKKQNITFANTYAWDNFGTLGGTVNRSHSEQIITLEPGKTYSIIVDLNQLDLGADSLNIGYKIANYNGSAASNTYDSGWLNTTGSGSSGKAGTHGTIDSVTIDGNKATYTITAGANDNALLLNFKTVNSNNKDTATVTKLTNLGDAVSIVEK